MSQKQKKKLVKKFYTELERLNEMRTACRFVKRHGIRTRKNSMFGRLFESGREQLRYVRGLQESLVSAHA